MAYKYEPDYDDFDRLLDEVYEGVFGIAPSVILRECDPIAYEVGFVDWLDGQDESWFCDNCNEEFDNEEDADECCAEEEDDETEEEDDDECCAEEEDDETEEEDDDE